MNQILKQIFAISVMCALASCMSLPANHTYSFALIGDQQYNAAEEALFPDLLDTISNEKLAFVVHLGDFKAGSNAPCTDALYALRRNELIVGGRATGRISRSSASINFAKFSTQHPIALAKINCRCNASPTFSRPIRSFRDILKTRYGFTAVWFM
jgi:hypothetical protein